MENIKKAIKHFECVKSDAVAVLDSGFGTKPNQSNIVYKNRKLYAELAINALEKQMPKKPIIILGRKAYTHSLGRLMHFHCPTCQRFIVAMYENDVERGGGIHKDLKGCSTCLQAIDFVGYYKIDKLDEEIEWNDHSTEKGDTNNETT